MFCRKLLILCSNSLNDVSWVWVNYEMMYNFAIQLITCGNKVCWKLFHSGLLIALSILTWYWIEHTSYFEFTKDTQCCILMGKLWGAFSEHVGNIDGTCVPKSFWNSDASLCFVLSYQQGVNPLSQHSVEEKVRVKIIAVKHVKKNQ